MLKIVVPMAGEGKRFAEHGHTFPKPLVEIQGRSMIEIVVGNLTPSEPHEFIFVCRHEHANRYALNDVLQLIAPECKIAVMQDATAGALCSVLLAMEHFAEDCELLIANSDQYLEANIDQFLLTARQANTDGCIMTFPSTHPKWSYVKLVDEEVVAVAEKRPISSHATAGLYYFRSSGAFLAAAEKMILKNASREGEFFVSPVYNELILTGKRITTHPIARRQMHSLGTPEDVDAFAALPIAKTLA
jgi:dTDP-glucose pyrophosphorylase